MILSRKAKTNNYQLAAARPRQSVATPLVEAAASKWGWLESTITILLSMIGVVIISRLMLVHKSLRLDESQSIWQASHSFTGTLHAVALDVHVPLYHLMLHYWIFFFGSSVETVRLPSLIFFLLTIPVIYLLSKQLVPRRWALVATVLFSFSPFMNWYANEARMYTLLVLMATLSQYFFVRILKTGRGWYLYGIVSIIGAYSHYFFMLNLASQGLFYIFNYKKFAPGSFKRFLLVFSLVIIALSPWLLYFHSLGSGSTTRPNLPKPSTVDFFNAYSQFIFGFQNDRINTILLSSWPLLLLMALIAVRRNRGLPPAVGFMATMTTLPVLLAYVLSLIVTPFFLSRYMISSVGPLLLLLIWFISQYRKTAARAAVAVLVIITALSSLQQATNKFTPVNEDYRAAATAVNDQVQPQDLVVLSAPFTDYPFEYYYHGAAQIQTLPIRPANAPGSTPPFVASQLPGEVAQLNDSHRYIFLLLSQDQGYESKISQYYLTHFTQISKTVYSPDLTLYVYKVGYYTVPPIKG